ncbi:MAG TPA: 4-hydroxythreonine-4-phosphate dehydrogenase [Deltaproteobacteria bacterium]|nr:MAG: 4-hydroxythreonine-4-phosphate dehydrogenase PdxA [Pseudomonadota bacterium]HBM54406.1 4-hydroxythreonine-4-phosphate dehydrogenase [Deltaproteobacteria bacterium]|tara:strand:- start:3466 stop:4467 length:1002 start_codon:yes stop_codon:yes gene_type:complete
MKPRIALIPGDPSGIGPELLAKLLAEPGLSEEADVMVIGDRHVLELGQQQAGMKNTFKPIDPLKSEWLSADSGSFAFHSTQTISIDDVRISEATQSSGASVLNTLNVALDFAKDGIVDAVVFAPFNKQAMHSAGLGHDDELHYMATRLKVNNYISELNTFDGMWTSRVTSHISLKDVAERINEHSISESVRLIHGVLCNSGIASPKISVAALNPHAGDGGNFGREEIDVIFPAVQSLQSEGLPVDGPWPSDTVFLKAIAKEIDAVVTMYHDQGQIALKLLGFSRGVTVQGGIPFPVTTPAHGTAFDIAGQGKANLGATRAAFDLACKMVSHWN